jgi:pimeloyl-ACP methyl ester carboxylesterase
MDSRYTLEAASKLGGLEIPVLLAWGEQDRFFEIELAERLEKLIGDARLVRFHEGLTFLPLDEPERLAEEIEAFVTSTSIGVDQEA